MPKFYIIIAQKIFFPNLGGGMPPISYAYDVSFSDTFQDIVLTVFWDALTHGET